MRHYAIAFVVASVALVSVTSATAVILSGCGAGSTKGHFVPVGSDDGGSGAGGDSGTQGGGDPNADVDGDGFTPAMGDCNDHDPGVHPGAMDVCGDHIDQDCDGMADETCDDDMDGYAVTQSGNLPGGDCNDSDPLVNPGAMEVYGDGVDNNCNGQIDEVPAACDQNVTKDPRDLAGALELCNPWVMSATVNNDSDLRARAILSDFGVYKPHAGTGFVVLSTGIAADANDPGFVIPQPGTQFTNNDPNPIPMMNANTCYKGADEPTVHDYVELTLTLKVPTNAHSFSFDFMFMSAEYPEFICTQYNDKFLAILDSKSFKGNISFDSKGQPLTVNAGFFDVCQSTMNNVCTKPISKLQGTGYERFDYMNRPIGGGTDWLRTISPVTPGETATIRFIIFDEGDHKFDSTVVIDNFQFQLDAAMAPMTVG